MEKKVKIGNMELADDILRAILSKLPAISLVRFRCVCKTWKSLMEDPHFVEMNMNTKKPGFVTLSYDSPGSLENFVLSYNSHKIKIDFSSVPNVFYKMTNSCNGLVGIYGDDTFYLANPSIMKVAALPSGTAHQSLYHCTPQFAIGFEDSRGEYIVVKIFHRPCDDYYFDGARCEVFSLNRSNSWKSVEDPPFFRLDSDILPCFLYGSIYWTQNDYRKAEIAVSFNLHEEKFGVIKHPEGSSVRERCTRVVALGGCLCIIDIPALRHLRQMNIWIQHDRSRSEFVKQYTIDFSKVAELCGDWFLIAVNLLTPLATEDGMIVIYNAKNGSKGYYDPLTMSFVKHEHFDYGNKVWTMVCSDPKNTSGELPCFLKMLKLFDIFAAPYTESIVWPWSNKQLRFFQIRTL